LKLRHAENARITDQPVAALISDLKSRGLLDDTLVIWAGEMGRTPHSSGTDGRDPSRQRLLDLDGRLWHWVPGGDLLRPGPFGRWDGGCVWGTPQLIELPNGDWALPYLAHNLPHKYPRGKLVGSTGYALWPKGRLIAVSADDRGEFTMIPIMAAGKRLKMNAVTQRTGWVKVEVAGVKGRGLTECLPIVGDQHWTRVRWKSGDDLGVSDAQALMLRLELNQARVYGLEFE
jgi:hypothetical protein